MPGYLSGQDKQDLTLATFFENSVQDLLQSTPDQDDFWDRVNVRLSEHRTIKLCVVAYGVALGLTGSAIDTALKRIKTGDSNLRKSRRTS